MIVHDKENILGADQRLYSGVKWMHECVTWGTEKRPLTVCDCPLYTGLSVKRVPIDRFITN